MITIDLNQKNKASSQYLNWNFNSMVRFGDKYLAASDAGLFTIGGNQDNGEAIDAYFIPVTTDFGLSNLKRVRFVYFGFEATSNLEIEITADEEIVRTYEIPTQRTGQQSVSIPVGRDIYGRYWSFKIRNTSGCDFSIDKINLLLNILPKGKGRLRPSVL